MAVGGDAAEHAGVRDIPLPRLPASAIAAAAPSPSKAADAPNDADDPGDPEASHPKTLEGKIGMLQAERAAAMNAATMQQMIDSQKAAISQQMMDLQQALCQNGVIDPQKFASMQQTMAVKQAGLMGSLMGWAVMMQVPSIEPLDAAEITMQQHEQWASEQQRCAKNSKKSRKRSRKESEAALLTKISTSLDMYLGVCGRRSWAKMRREKKRKEAIDTSQNITKNFLAAKTLVKNIAKACGQEGAARTLEAAGKPNALLEMLFDTYKDKYTFLSIDMLVDGVVHYNAKNQAAEQCDAKEEDKEKEDDKSKLPRIIALVELAMTNYLQKIRALKKSREKAKGKTLSRERREQEGDTASSPHRESESVKPRSVKEIQESFLIDEILEKYALERETQNQLTDSLFEMVVEITKKEHRMELNIPLRRLKDIVRSRYDKRMAKEEEKNYNQLREEVYRRYAQATEAHGGKPADELDAIVAAVQREYEIVGADETKLKVWCRKRFGKENPGLAPAAGNYSVGAKRRRPEGG